MIIVVHIFLDFANSIRGFELTLGLIWSTNITYDLQGRKLLSVIARESECLIQKTRESLSFGKDYERLHQIFP